MFFFQVYCDNLFTTLDLLDHMGERAWGVTGTLRANRLNGVPLPTKKEAEKTMKRGEVKAVFSSDLMVATWKDNQPVFMASNVDAVDPLQECQRYSQKDGKYVVVPQPMVVRQYNNSMGGVDLLDNGVKNYSISMRIRKWWWSIYSWFLNVNMVQAWRLFRFTMKQRGEALAEKQKVLNVAWEEEMEDKGMSRTAKDKAKRDRELEQIKERAELRKLADIGQLEFIRQVVEVTIKTHSSRVPPARGSRAKVSSSTLETLRLDGKDHLIKVTKVAGVCKLCRGRTKFRCMKCDVALHAERCFWKFHGGDSDSD